MFLICFWYVSYYVCQIHLWMANNFRQHNRNAKITHAKNHTTHVTYLVVCRLTPKLSCTKLFALTDKLTRESGQSFAFSLKGTALARLARRPSAFLSPLKDRRRHRPILQSPLGHAAWQPSPACWDPCARPWWRHSTLGPKPCTSLWVGLGPPYPCCSRHWRLLVNTCMMPSFLECVILAM